MAVSLTDYFRRRPSGGITSFSWTRDTASRASSRRGETPFERRHSYRVCAPLLAREHKLLARFYFSLDAVSFRRGIGNRFGEWILRYLDGVFFFFGFYRGISRERNFGKV